MRTRALLLPVLAATAIALGACGEDEGAGEGTAGSGAPPTTEATPAPTTEAQTPPEGGTGDAAAQIAEQIRPRGRPQIPRPSGEPPAALQVADVRPGDGAVLRAGDTISVQYAGASWSTGEEFDASYGSGQAFPLQLGAGMVIPGWDQGLQGMRVGGRRVLVIPPDLAYGPEGQPPVIAPNETLVFVVDAQRAQGAG